MKWKKKKSVLSPIKFIAGGSFCLTTAGSFVYTLFIHFQLYFFFAQVNNWSGEETLCEYAFTQKWPLLFTFRRYVVRGSVYSVRHLYCHRKYRCGLFFSTSTQFADSFFFLDLIQHWYVWYMEARWMEMRFIKFILSLSISSESLKSAWRSVCTM